MQLFQRNQEIMSGRAKFEINALLELLNRRLIILNLIHYINKIDLIRQVSTNS